jgi:predicted Zn finger-like uncharacterized protein
MIVECPNCATRFMVTTQALGAAGRTVRCGQCSHVWHQKAEAQEPKAQNTPYPNSPLTASAAAEGVSPLFTSLTAQAEFDEKTPTSQGGNRGRQRSNSLKLPRKKGIPPKQKVKALALWFGLFGLLVFGSGSLWQNRENIVELWPQSGALFTLFDPELASYLGPGLDIPKERIRIERTQGVNGPILAISGTVHNISQRVQTIPPLRLSLTGPEAGAALANIVVEAVPNIVEPGALGLFQGELPDIPTGQGVAVSFVTDGPPSSGAAPPSDSKDISLNTGEKTGEKTGETKTENDTHSSTTPGNVPPNTP